MKNRFLNLSRNPKPPSWLSFVAMCLPSNGLPITIVFKKIAHIAKKCPEFFKQIGGSILLGPEGPIPAYENEHGHYPFYAFQEVARQAGYLVFREKNFEGKRQIWIGPGDKAKRLWQTNPELKIMLSTIKAIRFPRKTRDALSVVIKDYGLRRLCDQTFEQAIEGLEAISYRSMPKNEIDRKSLVTETHRLRHLLGPTEDTKISVAGEYGLEKNMQKLFVFQYLTTMLAVELLLILFGDSFRRTSKFKIRYIRKLKNLSKELKKEQNLFSFDLVYLIEKFLEFANRFEEHDLDNMIPITRELSQHYEKTAFIRRLCMALQQIISSKVVAEELEIDISRNNIFMAYFMDEDKSESICNEVLAVITESGGLPVLLERLPMAHNLTPQEWWRAVIPLCRLTIALLVDCNKDPEHLYDEIETSFHACIPILLLVERGVDVPNWIKDKTTFKIFSYNSLPKLYDWLKETVLSVMENGEKTPALTSETIREPSISKSTAEIVTPARTVQNNLSPRTKYRLLYKDLLKQYPRIQRRECRVAIAQIGVSKRGDLLGEFYEEKAKGLFGLSERNVEVVRSKVKNMIEVAHDNEVNILLFPELTVDLNYDRLLEDISSLAEAFEMYVIPGSYHDLQRKRNLSVVLGPDGILWEQEKHIPSIIHYKGKRIKEGIEVDPFPHETTICNTEFGRIAIVICRDFLDMDLRVELKNVEPPVDLILNPSFTPVTADFKATHFDARRSIYAYCFFANVAEFGDSLIYTPEKESVERRILAGEENLIYKDVDLFRLRSERKKWEREQRKERSFIQSTR